MASPFCVLMGRPNSVRLALYVAQSGSWSFGTTSLMCTPKCSTSMGSVPSSYMLHSSN